MTVRPEARVTGLVPASLRRPAASYLTPAQQAALSAAVGVPSVHDDQPIVRQRTAAQQVAPTAALRTTTARGGVVDVDLVHVDEADRAVDVDVPSG
jgi:hypothetical protein